MLSVKVQKKLQALTQRSKQKKRCKDLHKILHDPTIWEQAFANIYCNKGALTLGVDPSTLDGFSHIRIKKLIQLVKQNLYRPHPVRRVYIPKKNGSLRPLGIPTGDDKLLQEAMRLILERIYEPLFSVDSHGFRPGKSCHTALEKIQRFWGGTIWMIEFDLEKFFDKIDHKILVEILEKRIDDRKFIQIIKHMLKAGYMENNQFHPTYSGTPQGGIISPLLANIVLHELDEYMYTLQQKHTRGRYRRGNPEYQRLNALIQLRYKQRRKLRASSTSSDKLNKIEADLKQMKRRKMSIPSVDWMDPHYRRFRYCRYADDWSATKMGANEMVVGPPEPASEGRLQTTLGQFC